MPNVPAASRAQIERLLRENGELHAALAEAQEKLQQSEADLRVSRELQSEGVTKAQCEAAGFCKSSCPACVCNCPAAAAPLPAAGGGASSACTYEVTEAEIDPDLRGPPAGGAKSPPVGCAPSRGLYEDKVAKIMYLPPDYCDVEARTNGGFECCRRLCLCWLRFAERVIHDSWKGLAMRSEGRLTQTINLLHEYYCAAGGTFGTDGRSTFERLQPSDVTYDADGQCHWGALRMWAGHEHVQMCTHDPKVDMQVCVWYH